MKLAFDHRLETQLPCGFRANSKCKIEIQFATEFTILWWGHMPKEMASEHRKTQFKEP